MAEPQNQALQRRTDLSIENLLSNQSLVKPVPLDSFLLYVGTTTAFLGI
jgi:hypothetical protein